MRLHEYDDAMRTRITNIRARMIADGVPELHTELVMQSRWCYESDLLTAYWAWYEALPQPMRGWVSDMGSTATDSAQRYSHHVERTV